MADLAKEKANTSAVIDLFIRLTRSIELTARKIFNKKYPSPLDNPINALKAKIDAITVKKKRDIAFEKFLMESRF